MYILITPAKNEAEHITEVLQSIVNQSLKPLLWVIVDDGSIDGTTNIIKHHVDRYPWIKCVTLNAKDRDITFHYSFVCKKGFDVAIEYCREKKIEYEYIGLLDADTVVVNNYFQKLINQFVDNRKLGIVSGGIFDFEKGNLKINRTMENLPAGTGRVWRKECFFETGGYPVEPSPDSISNAKAIINGWEIKRSNNITAIHKRRTGSADGLVRGYKINGEMAYYLDKHPILVVSNALFYCFEWPYYLGLAFLYGYLGSFLNKREKIKDDEIRNYFHARRLTEYFEKFLYFKKRIL